MLIYFGLFRHLLFNGTVSYLSFYAEFDLLDDMLFFLKKAYKYKYNSDYVLYSGSHFDNISANMFTPHSLI